MLRLRVVWSVSAVLLLFLLGGAQSVSAQVVLNEIVSNGIGALEDWVEIKNTGVAPEDLSGWGFTDDLADPFKYTIPNSTILAPGSYLVLEQAELIFGISSQGEDIGLFRDDGVLIDQFPPQALSEGQSFGRIPDGTGCPVVLEMPTKLAANLGEPGPPCDPPVPVPATDTWGFAALLILLAWVVLYRVSRAGYSRAH